MPRLLFALGLLAAWPAGIAAAQGTAPASPPDQWLPRTTAELSVLDKVRAQPSSVTVKVGQSMPFGSLTITVRGCVSRPADLPQDSAAFLEVTDPRAAGAAFRGWMLASEPALSQLQHPLYDMRVLSCH